MVAIMADERLLTVPEVADRLRVSEFTVRVWLRQRKLKGYRPGGTKAGWRIRESDLDQFIEAGAPAGSE
jgi:excisionase family DNA binding protein